MNENIQNERKGGVRQFFSSKAFVWIIVAAVLGVVVYAVVLSGSPAKQRALQLDQQRISALQQIASALDQYWERNEQLPKTLEELQDSRYYYIPSLKDPETSQPYEYKVLAEKNFELCSVFALPSKEDRAFLRFPSKVWEHGAGRTCFELEVQPRIID